jgi:hypothetical protein
LESSESRWLHGSSSELERIINPLMVWLSPDSKNKAEIFYQKINRFAAPDEQLVVEFQHSFISKSMKIHHLIISQKAKNQAVEVIMVPLGQNGFQIGRVAHSEIE